MIVSAVVERFIKWCRETKRPRTVTYYQGRLKPWVERFGTREYESLTPIEIFDFLTEIGEGKKPSTKRHNIVGFESMQSWALKFKIIKVRLIDKIDKPPMGKRDTLPTAEETQKLLEHASPAFLDIYTGLRLSAARPGELCSATIADWLKDESMIVLQVHKTMRTGRPRRIPVSQPFAELLEKTTAGRTEGPLFLTTSGKPWTSEYLSRTYTRLRKKAGLRAGLVLYLTRHEAGTELAASTEDINVVRLIMGHADLQTTLKYLHPKDAKLLDACQHLGKLVRPQAPPPTTEPDCKLSNLQEEPKKDAA